MADQTAVVKTITATNTGSGAGAAGGAAAAVPVSVQQMAQNLRTRAIAMPAGRRNLLLASSLFLLAAIAAMAWYAERPDWKVLYSGLESRDAEQVTQELAAAGVPYRMTTDGSGIEVPSDAINQARIEVAKKGMPQSGRMGFELFDKPNWVGSEFDERVNYQRALEGELEHTIETLGVVRSARVHLVMPQQSLFAAEDKIAKASVVLKLKKPAVDETEADSIRNLVAGAVDNLSPTNVVLVDADGRVNLMPHAKNLAEGDVEQALEAKLVSLMEPLAGRDNVRATVRVSYDQTSEDKTDEVFDPTLTAPTQMQRSEQSSSATAKASGVPGTASNTPAAAAPGAVQGSAKAAAPGTPPLLQKDALPVYPAGAAPGQMLKQESGMYAVTKHTTHTEMGPGRVGRVTAAILVNDRKMTESAGKLTKTVWKPRTADEMHRLEELAQAAVGYDSKRGDQVVIENMSFSGNAPEAPASMLDKVSEGTKGFLRTQPNLVRTLMLGACGVLLVMFVLRPVGAQVMSTLREPILLEEGTRPSEAMQLAEAHKMVAALGESQGQMQTTLHESPIPVKRVRAKSSAQAIFENVSERIKEDPLPSTRLLQSWIVPEKGAAPTETRSA